MEFSLFISKSKTQIGIAHDYQKEYMLHMRMWGTLKGPGQNVK